MFVIAEMASVPGGCAEGVGMQGAVLPVPARVWGAGGLQPHHTPPVIGLSLKSFHLDAEN